VRNYPFSSTVQWKPFSSAWKLPCVTTTLNCMSCWHLEQVLVPPEHILQDFVWKMYIECKFLYLWCNYLVFTTIAVCWNWMRAQVPRCTTFLHMESGHHLLLPTSQRFRDFFEPDDNIISRTSATAPSTRDRSGCIIGR
jgi:hypothetical protein